MAWSFWNSVGRQIRRPMSHVFRVVLLHVVEKYEQHKLSLLGGGGVRSADGRSLISAILFLGGLASYCSLRSVFHALPQPNLPSLQDPILSFPMTVIQRIYQLNLASPPFQSQHSRHTTTYDECIQCPRSEASTVQRMPVSHLHQSLAQTVR